MSIVKVYEKIKKTHYYYMSFIVLVSSPAIGYLTFYVVYSVYLNRFTVHSAIIPVIELLLMIFLFFISSLLPSFLGHMTFLLIYDTQVTWRELCRNFRLNVWHSQVPVTDTKMMSIFNQIKHGQKVFMLSLTTLIKIDRLGINKVFTLSITLNIIMNIFGILELAIGRLEQVKKGLIVAVIIVQLVLIFSAMMLFLLTSKQLYVLNGSILHHQIEFMKHSFYKWRLAYRLRALVRWHHFVEIVHTRRKFVFRFGTLGKITSSNIVGFLPIYTALLFRFIPIIIGEDSEHSLRSILCQRI